VGQPCAISLVQSELRRDIDNRAHTHTRQAVHPRAGNPICLRAHLSVEILRIELARQTDDQLLEQGARRRAAQLRLLANSLAAPRRAFNSDLQLIRTCNARQVPASLPSSEFDPCRAPSATTVHDVLAQSGQEGGIVALQIETFLVLRRLGMQQPTIRIRYIMEYFIPGSFHTLAFEI
jgi:hypothetical protein